MRSFLRFFLVSQMVLLFPRVADAATLRAPAPVAPTLNQLTQRAGCIFAGTVLTVERMGAQAPGEVATVRITFRVDQAIRGVAQHQTLTIREWAGLWDAGESYRPGEQVLLFLYRNSQLGLTSPVNGSQGRFELDRSGRVLLNQERLAGLQGKLPARSPAKTILLSPRDLGRALRGQEE
jgi:hypothetical protein